MALPFRQRIFLILVALTATPTTLAVIGWALSVRSAGPSAGALASLEEVGNSARALAERVDTLRLSPGQRAAVRQHFAQVSNAVTLARRADVYLRYYTAGVAVVILVLGGLVVFASVRLAGHLSRQLSRPIDELVGWTRLIRRRQPLPAGDSARGAPDFEALRQGLRELAGALEAARQKELEAERLRAFREVARRVAHEIKNPLTAMRIAVDQVGRTVGPSDSRTATAVQVLGAETTRVERRPRARHPPGAAAAGVRALFHDQARRHGPGARAGAADPRGPRRHDHGGRNAGGRRHVRRRLPHVSPRILLVDDEANIRKMVGALLQSEGFETAEAGNGTAALAAVERGAADAVLLDLMMPGGPDGLATLEQLRRLAPDVPVVMMSGKANLADAVRATKLGAFQFLEKPLTPEGLLVAIRGALELARTRAENRRLHEALGHSDPLVGGSRAMDELRALIARVAPTDARVLITDESGEGKELVASAIHRQSAPPPKPFVRVNSAAIPKDLVESEMFGHERGAFTGATERRVGRFELADGGTLFLDEVGDLGPEAQAKLLRVLESGVIERLGGEKPVTVDVRVIAATNKELTRAARQGHFREDLLFRLNVLPVHIPPLRERPEDVRPLVEHFAGRQAARRGRPLGCDAGALRLLAAYQWPGNVRELANIVERLAVLGAGDAITAEGVARGLPGDRGWA